MWKIAEWVGKTVAAALIVSVLSIWTAGFIVTSYLDSILKQYELPLEVQPMAMSGIWGKLWGAEPRTTGKQETAEQTGPRKTGQDEEAALGGTGAGSGGGSTGGMRGGDDEEDASSDLGTDRQDGTPGSNQPGSGNAGESSGGTGSGSTGESSGDRGGTGSGSIDGSSGGTGGTGTGSGSGSGADDGGEAEGPPLSTETGSGSGTRAEGGSSGDTPVMSSGEIAEAKEQMSEADKQLMFGLLLNKLPQEAWQSISTYMENGLTEQELTQVQQIVAQYLNDEEYAQLMNILSKY
ncbi:hypothetical protein PA598K_00636 [Paenibacillus sp. 598K]|uniref:hypothetical protein n=1 Tax=Paenibacillus sp. 598K TaxID=1117987 RepID=UPI000FF91337|nr:hypothetical protein [Paenibacillus sp. 598K]GBF72387.1 hypothetical protein PA598K_00636 [Paenibacillus sp. 598K]